MMKTLGKTGKNWLITFHILFVAIWIGTALFTILLRFNNRNMASDETLLALHVLSNKSDILIYISGIGVLITSIMIGTLTSWGFFRYPWMVAVWIIFLANLVMGAAVLGPLKKNILAFVESEGLGALQNSIYTRNHLILSLAGILQVLLLAS
jgi:hypothetical protein